MPTFKRFEELPVWRQTIKLAEGTEDFLASAKVRITRPKRDQLERASLSVSNNIAEGFERGTTNELIAFLYIARGSAAEVRSMLCFLERRPTLSDLKSQISNLRPQGRRRILLPSAPRLGQFAPKLRHCGAAPSQCPFPIELRDPQSPAGRRGGRGEIRNLRSGTIEPIFRFQISNLRSQIPRACSAPSTSTATPS